MAYVATGTAGNDVLNQSTDTGPGTIVGLAGDDCIFSGTGPVQGFGNSGNDTIALQAGNTGTVNGGSENDSISGSPGAMQSFGSDGADTVVLGGSSAQTVVGGNNSSDAADFISVGTGADLLFGNGGNDTINPNDGPGANTAIGGFGNDCVFSPGGPGANDLVFGNQGNDTLIVSPGSDTSWGGQGNDCILAIAAGGSPLLFGNEGNDTLASSSPGATSATLVGGNNSADGANSLLGNTSNEWMFGNGGADTVDGGAGNNTVIGGQGGNSLLTLAGADLIFANEANDTVSAGDGANTVFGGQGNDSILAGVGRDTLQGNEGNDTIRGDNGTVSIDTISGGAGNDVFAYIGATPATEDGENATGGGPVEFITDVDFSVDRFDTTPNITFASNLGAGTGGTLVASATNAIDAATALNGGVNTVAAQFTFGGRTYLAINLANNGFLDADDLLLDITGATGAISGSNFI